MKNLKIPKKINRSLSESEHNLFDILWQNQKSNLAIYIAYVFLFNNADKKSLRYYDPIWADKIYSNNKSTIEKANQLLPENEKLPLYPHQPKGYTTTWNKGYIDAKDIEIILNAFDESEKIANSPYKKQCPKDFNLAAYLAKHFDVFIKNLDPYEHCIK